MFEITVKIIAGLGLFMFGAKMISQNIGQITTHRFRSIVGKFTKNPLFAAVWGFTFGAIVLDTNAITYSIASMASTNAIEKKKAVPLLSWTNPGACILFVVAFLDIKLVIFLLLGIAGLLMAIERPKKYQNILVIIFSFGMIFFGVNYMGEVAAPIKDMPWFQNLIINASTSYILLFFITAVLSFMLQSIDGFLMLSLAMAKAGILTVDQAMIIIYGCTLGESFISFVLSFSLKGVARQFAMLQVLFNLIGVCIFLPLFFIENILHIPLIKALVTSNSFGLEQQMAGLLLLFATTSAIVVTILGRPLLKLVEKLSPPTREEDAAALKYLEYHSLNEPVSAIDLVEKEQQRLIGRFPQYIEIIRSFMDNKDSGYNLEELHRIFEKLSGEIDFYISELVNKIKDKTYSQKFVNIINKQNLIANLEDNLYQLINTLKQKNWSADMDSIIHSFIEGLDTILLTANDAFSSLQEFEVNLLRTITSDKGNLMDTIRDKYLRAQMTLATNEKQVLLFITEQFEKNVWLMRKLAMLLEIKSVKEKGA